MHKRLALEVEEEVERLHSLGLKPQAIAQMLHKSNEDFVSLRTIYNTTAAARRAKRAGESPIQFLPNPNPNPNPECHMGSTLLL
ncbi:hypothetical protein PGT21_016105 [Puccinia graminis f. sp. tritici]|uniref:Uncharacterized protein n=1 Tax=Puccinia graminis f. sp. tritici TaxID=56615 RepID=A0A5B0RX06_PUCGR|nr:hypothetical protein PGT21_016105 [Puccinia graminis f. sp. tritici]KAA1129373.1 hypothetical protein PGTUg99_030902 [Puccinia graminis f. sp. tritici]